MNLTKKFGLASVSFVMVLMMTITMTTSYADDNDNWEISGEYYTTNIKAYINGKYIDSWNINGQTYVNMDELSNYGYDVVKNNKLGVIRLFANYYSDQEAILYESFSSPLYDNDQSYKKHIEYMEPSYEVVATPRGSLEAIGSAKDTVTVQFSNTIKEEYINEKYIPIYYRDKNVSKYFTYSYNKESKQLIIKMKADSFSNYTFGADNVYNENDFFTVYFLIDNKDQLGTATNKILKYKVNFDINREAQIKESKSEFAGEYKASQEQVYVIGERGMVRYNTFLLSNGKKVISIEALGEFFWDETRRNIYVYSETFLENRNREHIVKLKEASTPVYKATWGEWIESTNPYMMLEKTLYNESVEKIWSNENEVVITFSKPIKEEYLNEDYIQIYRKNQLMNHWFEYDYNKETHTLSIKLQKINGKIKIDNDFSRILYDQEDNIIKDYLGSRFDVFIREGIMATDGDVLQDSLRLTCDVTWQLTDNKNDEFNGKVKEVTTWNINGTKVLSFKEYEIEDKAFKEFDEPYAMVEPLNEKAWQYYRRNAQPLYKGFVNEWVEEVTPFTEFIQGENGSVIQSVNNTTSDITIMFKKDMDERYINGDYIKIFSADNEVSYIFDYVYDQENKKLTIKKVKEVALYPSEDEKEGNTYDIYLMKGMTSTLGEKLIKSIRITVGMESRENH